MNESGEVIDDRQINIEIMRILAALWVLAYHLANTVMPWKDMSFIQKIIICQFAGGGRIAVNVFVVIGSWFLCEKEFQTNRILKLWITVLLYSITVGMIFYFRNKNIQFLINSLLPISNEIVWFISTYIKLLFIAPLLNVLTRKKNIRFYILILFIIINCSVTIRPTGTFILGNLEWFCCLYMYVSYFKLYIYKNTPRNRLMPFLWAILAFFCWNVCVFWRFKYDYFSSIFPGFLMQRYDVFEVYLQTLPPFACAFFIFLFFYSVGKRNGKFSYDNKKKRINGPKNGGVLRRIITMISAGTLDVYVLLSMNGPGGRLFWIELFGLDNFYYGPTAIGLTNFMIIFFMAFFITIFISLVRKKFVKFILEVGFINSFMKKIDKIIND